MQNKVERNKKKNNRHKQMQNRNKKDKVYVLNKVEAKR